VAQRKIQETDSRTLQDNLSPSVLQD